MGGNAALPSNKLIRIYVCVNGRVTNAQIFTLLSWTNLGTLTISDPINGFINIGIFILWRESEASWCETPTVQGQCHGPTGPFIGFTIYSPTIYWLSPGRCIIRWQVSIQHHGELEGRLKPPAAEPILTFLCVLTNKLCRGETAEGRQVGGEVVNLPSK